ncbi:MAG: hypothetical protein II411_00060, partial [Lachnospiraceae bacterium]|nr:hypothetical protein [Lachnospiraceae bacterium]
VGSTTAPYKASGSQLADSRVGLIVSKANPYLEGLTFSIVFDNDGSAFHFERGSDNYVSTYWFSSDFGDGTKWIPFGWKDNSGNTCCLYDNLGNVADGVDKRAVTAYEIIPNDDYFLNCYWTDAK